MNLGTSNKPIRLGKSNAGEVINETINIIKTSPLSESERQTNIAKSVADKINQRRK